MHILFATAEIAPFTAPTNVAETCSKLSLALGSYRPPMGEHDMEQDDNPISSISIVTPLYSSLDPDAMRLARRLTPLTVPRDKGSDEVFIYEGRSDEGVRIFFLAHPLLSKEGLTSATESEAAERFALFSRAVVEFCRAVPFPVDIVHCHGWQTALVPVFLDARYGDDDKLAEVLTVVAIQNLDAQGRFPKKVWKSLGLPKAYRTDEGIGFEGELSFMKGGIVFADYVTAASPSYAAEIVKKGRGQGLEGYLAERSDELFGLIDGIDTDAWDPRTDPHLPINYDFDNLNAKRRNKADLQHIFGLPTRPLTPLVGIFGPLRDKASLAVVANALETLWGDGRELQVVVLGECSAPVAQLLEAFRGDHPAQVSVHADEDSALRHRALAGIDAILLPKTSGFDAGQLHAMRYGTVPVIPSNAGLRDTVTSWNGVGTRPDSGVGFTFEVGDPDALADALSGMVELYHKPRQWRPILEQCMKMDFSWKSAAKRYVDLYTDLIYPEED